MFLRNFALFLTDRKALYSRRMNSDFEEAGRYMTQLHDIVLILLCSYSFEELIHIE
jgi:hypothetical protein